MTASRAAWIAWIAAGVVFGVSLTQPAATFPANRWWLRAFSTPEIGSGRMVGQEFVMSRDGLNAIEFHPVPVDSLRGRLEVRLVDLTEGATSRVVRTGTFDVADLVRRESYRFEFEPIADSKNRKYRFELTADDGMSGIALRATKGDPYPRGTLTFNGTSRWADLRFRATAPTTSIWQALWTGPIQSGTSGRIVLALLVINWMAAGVLLRVLAVRLDSAEDLQ